MSEPKTTTTWLVPPDYENLTGEDLCLGLAGCEPAKHVHASTSHKPPRLFAQLQKLDEAPWKPDDDLSFRAALVTVCEPIPEPQPGIRYIAAQDVAEFAGEAGRTDFVYPDGYDETLSNETGVSQYARLVPTAA